MKKYLAIAILGLGLSSGVHADGELYATNLDGLIQSDSKGLYDQILKLFNLKYQALPAARAENYMVRDSGCLFPVDRRFLKINADFIESEPIDIVNINIYTLKGGLETVDDLKGKSIGLRLGLNYGPKVNALQKIVKVDLAPNLDSNLQKLKAGRVDAVIEFHVDVEEYQKTHPGFKFKVSNVPVDIHNDSISCYNNPANQELIANFNKLLKKNRKEVNSIIGK